MFFVCLDCLELQGGTLSKHKVSVIIPCYNQGKFVTDSINSVLAQTYKNIEIVVVNDGSTDDSREVISALAEKYENILFIDNNENKGVIYVRNFAIKSCHGDYILPLDADDTIEPTYIEKAVRILDENPKIGIVYCKARMFGIRNEVWDLKDFDKSNILYANCIFATSLFRKSDFIDVGMYKDYMYYGCEDYDLWLSFIERGFDVYRIDEFLFNYRQYEEHSRTKTCIENYHKVMKSIVKNHIDLYLEDKRFWDKLYSDDIFDYYERTIKLKSTKLEKYRKIYRIFLTIIIVETILLIILFGVIIWRMYG